MVSNPEDYFDLYHPIKPTHLWGWINAHEDSLKPPVSNALIHGKGCQFKIMVVGGPNVRTDYHINTTEEWFYQLKGNMVLKIVDGGEFKDVFIPEGSQYLLAPHIPHSPQRGPNSIGLVLEMERPEDALDGLRWYCRNGDCRAVIYEEFFKCEDLGTQLKEKILDYYSSEAKRTCPKCGHIDERPKEAFALLEERAQVAAAEAKSQDQSASADDKKASVSAPCDAVASQDTANPHVPPTHKPPLDLWQWIRDNADKFAPPVGNYMLHQDNTQWKVMVVGGPNQRTDYHINPTEEWFYQLQGDMVLKVVAPPLTPDGTPRFIDIPIKEGETLLLPANTPHSPQRFENTRGLVIETARPKDALDKVRFYCRSATCAGKGVVVTEYAFRCDNLGVQIRDALLNYYSEDNVSLRTCKVCGQVDTPL